MALRFETRDDIGIFHSEGRVEYEQGVEVYRSGLETIAAQDGQTPRLLFDLLDSEENRSHGELRALVDTAAQHLDRGRMALVASSELLYGLSRIFGAYAEQAGFEAEVFKSRKEALSWLGEPARSTR